MPARSKFRSHSNVSAALDRIRDCHRAMASLQSEGRPFDPVYVKTLKVSEALHELAEELTGDPNALMPRGHKTSFADSPLRHDEELPG